MKRILLIIALTLPLWAADVTHTKKGNSITLVFYDDGKEFEADSEVLKASKTIHNMLTDVGSNTGEPIPITSISSGLFMQTLYPLMQIIHAHPEESVMEKRINESLQTLDFDQTKDLLLAANFLDIPQLLPFVAERFAWLLTSPEILKQYAKNQNFIQNLSLPEELLNIVAEHVKKTPKVFDTLFPLFNRTMILPTTENNASIAFSPDGTLLASSDYQGTIKLWNPQNGNLIRTVQTGARWIRSLAFAPNGTFIAAGSEDGGPYILNLNTYNISQVPLHLPAGSPKLSMVAFSSDGLLVCGAGTTIIVFDLVTNTTLHTLHTNQPMITRGNFKTLICSPDGTLLVSSLMHGIVQIWKLTTGKLLNTFNSNAPENYVSPCAFMDNDTLVIGSYREIILLNPISGEQKKFSNMSETIKSLVSFPKNSLIASGSTNGILQIQNSDGKIMHRLQGHEELVGSLAFSRDGTLLISFGFYDRNLKIWNPVTGKLLLTTRSRSHVYSSHQECFSPTDDILAWVALGASVQLLFFDIPYISLEILLFIALDSDNDNQENVQSRITQSLAAIQDPIIKTKLEKYFAATETVRVRKAWLQRFLDAFNKTMNQLE